MTTSKSGIINDYIEKLLSIEKDIYEYSVGSVPNDVVGLFSGIIEGNLIDSSDSQRLIALNQIMGECLSAMQTCDYLLLADMLRYELKPVLEGVE
jgi:hypothetical protein